MYRANCWIYEITSHALDRRKGLDRIQDLNIVNIGPSKPDLHVCDILEIVDTLSSIDAPPQDQCSPTHRHSGTDQRKATTEVVETPEHTIVDSGVDLVEYTACACLPITIQPCGWTCLSKANPIVPTEPNETPPSPPPIAFI